MQKTKLSNILNKFNEVASALTLDSHSTAQLLRPGCFKFQTHIVQKIEASLKLSELPLHHSNAWLLLPGAVK